MPGQQTQLTSYLYYYSTSYSSLSLNCSYARVSPPLRHKSLIFSVFCLALQEAVARLPSEALPGLLEGLDERKAGLSEVEPLLFIDLSHFFDSLMPLVVVVEVAVLQSFVFGGDEFQ